MKRLLLALALVCVAGSSAFAADGKGNSKWGPTHTGKIPFVIGFEKGMAEAKFSGRPVMLFFTTTW